jgi:hypothetical protein
MKTLNFIKWAILSYLLIFIALIILGTLTYYLP